MNLTRLLILVNFIMIVYPLNSIDTKYRYMIGGIFLLVAYRLSTRSNNKLEHMSEEGTEFPKDPEAIHNIASMYNADQKTLKLTNLEVTGTIKADGKITSKENIESDKNVIGKIGGTFGNGRIQKWNGNSDAWTQFSHKNKTNKSSFAIAHKNDGTTIINAPSGKNVRIKNHDNTDVAKFEREKITLHKKTHTRQIQNSDWIDSKKLRCNDICKEGGNTCNIWNNDKIGIKSSVNSKAWLDHYGGRMAQGDGARTIQFQEKKGSHHSNHWKFYIVKV